MQLLKFKLAADVEPRLKHVFRLATGLRLWLAQAHVPQMFVDNMRGRQPGDDTRKEQNSRDNDSQVIDLAQPKEEVRNRVNRRHHVEGKERRKCDL
jgi:hypothetical protein